MKIPNRTPWMLCALCMVVAPVSHAAQQAGHAQVRGDLGVALAMQGEPARAESVFVSMLSHTRGDSRALNGLGNLRLLRGEFGVAMAFYDRALRGDSADAGIHLNRATALMLMGDDARANEAAQTAIRLAGSVEAAQALLGLSPDAPEAARAADKTAIISKDDVRAMLRTAAAAVPTDTGRASNSASQAAKKKTPTWRSAGPRAADPTDNSSSANLLYWKQ
jgi:tetratricopeptide (TPR) repeat protein